MTVCEGKVLTLTTFKCFHFCLTNLALPHLPLSQRPPSSVATLATNTAPSRVSLNPVQPSPSLQGPSFNLPFENWVYQAQAAAVYR